MTCRASSLGIRLFIILFLLGVFIYCDFFSRDAFSDGCAPTAEAAASRIFFWWKGKNLFECCFVCTLIDWWVHYWLQRGESLRRMRLSHKPYDENKSRRTLYMWLLSPMDFVACAQRMGRSVGAMHEFIFDENVALWSCRTTNRYINTHLTHSASAIREWTSPHAIQCDITDYH